MSGEWTRKLADRARGFGIDATFMRFAVVGITTTVLDLGLFALLAIGAGLDPLLSNILSYSACIVASFLLNRAWTFGLQGNAKVERHAAKFAATYISSLVISTALVWLFALVFPKVIAKALSLPFNFLWNYALSRRWVFR